MNKEYGDLTINDDFGEDKLDTVEQQSIHSRILEQASDTAEKLTELECKVNDIKCWNSEMEGKVEVLTFTDEAQDIFNEYYDQQVSELYCLLNLQYDHIKNHIKNN